MKLTFIRLLLFSICSLVLVRCSSSSPSGANTPDPDFYLTKDVVSDSIFPPTLRELTFNSSGSSIFGFEYVANGEGPHPTVVLVHANPGNERNLDVAQALRRAGYNVVYFDYRGTWGSQGTYSYANCIEDTRAVIDYLVDPANRQELRVNPKQIFLLGHNLGAGIALIEGLQDERVKAVAVLSLVNPYTTFRGGDAEFNFSDMAEYFSGLGMVKTDGKKFVLDITRDLPKYNIEQLLRSSKKRALIIDEHKNNENLEQLAGRRITYEVWDTDLEFSDRRIALTKKIKQWLDVQKARKAAR
jgi:uncharacterized protein